MGQNPVRKAANAFAHRRWKTVLEKILTVDEWTEFSVTNQILEDH
jgi:hypothetical protein